MLEKMLTGEKSIQDQEWQSNMKFICTVGHKQWYNKNNIKERLALVQPCTCYTRCDEESTYILVEYNIVHTHNLDYRVIEEQQLVFLGCVWA